MGSGPWVQGLRVERPETRRLPGVHVPRGRSFVRSKGHDLHTWSPSAWLQAHFDQLDGSLRVVVAPGERPRRAPEPGAIRRAHPVGGTMQGTHATGLDLDDDQRRAAGDHEVQLAVLGDEAPGEQARAGTPQVPCREPFPSSTQDRVRQPPPIRAIEQTALRGGEPSRPCEGPNGCPNRARGPWSRPVLHPALNPASKRSNPRCYAGRDAAGATGWPEGQPRGDYSTFSFGSITLWTAPRLKRRRTPSAACRVITSSWT